MESALDVQFHKDLHPMQSAFCFTLAWIYLLVWFKRRERSVYLLFSCSCVAAGANVYGPTRKLGRGLSNFSWRRAEVFVTVTTVNTHDGNAAAAESAWFV
jgi:hypothetical protein